MNAVSPSVSVGMPVYNSERWITRSIESILGQSYRDLELVICDNASTDSTQEICREYAARDSRVRYSRNPHNLGMNENFNLVFQNSTGKYYKWASSNDECAPSLIEQCVAVLEARPSVVLCYGRTRLMRDRSQPGEPYDDNLNLSDENPCLRFQKFLQQIRLNNVMNGVMRRSALLRTSMIGLYLASDIVLMGELALHGQFVELPDYLFFRSMTADTATTLKTRDRLLDYYDPKARNYRLFQNWKQQSGYFAAATRAPLTPRDRACVYGYLLRQMISNRDKLLDDLSLAARAAFAGPRRTI